MKNYVTADDLIQFETRVADAFNSGEIRAPIHLYSGNEEQLISIFKEIDENDWVLCTWRSHYQCLLKGVPEEDIFREIIAGRSISLCFPEHRIFSSAIAGGTIPIATGIAMAIERRCEKNQVHCFVGDMTAEMGIAHECIKYSENHNLPIRFIVEDNEKSVCTNTREAWGIDSSTYRESSYPRVQYYQYTSIYPHAGAGTRVEF